MEATELRVDNWVNSPYGFVLISEIQHAQCTIRNPDFSVNVGEWYNKIEPIPLTEEILLKCGAEKGIENVYEQGRFILQWLEKYKYWYVTNLQGVYVTKVEFVHEWQNTWFVLQGQELTVNL